MSPRLHPSPSATSRGVAVALGAFAASRVVGLFSVYAVRFILPGYGMVPAMTRWDSAWYLEIAAHGYPRSLPPAGGPTPLGFFPLFPLLTRAVADATPLGLAAAAVAVNTVAAAAATVLVWLLARDVFDVETADRAVFLVCFFPGAYAWTFAYTEGLFIACGAATLLLLHRRRFWAAALSAGIGSAARPTGYVLTVTCAFAVLAHWRRTREWKPLPSIVLAGSGVLAFFAYLAAHTGDALAWKHAQEQGWGQHLALRGSMLHEALDYLVHPVNELNVFVPVATTLALVPLAWVLVRARPPRAWIAFVVVALVPSLLSTAAAFTPRHLFALFPLLVALAARLRADAYLLTLATFAGLFAFLVLVMGATSGVTP